MTTEQEYIELAEDCKNRIEEKNQKIKRLEHQLQTTRNVNNQLYIFAKKNIFDYMYLANSLNYALCDMDPDDYRDNFKQDDIKGIISSIRDAKINETTNITHEIPKLLKTLDNIKNNLCAPMSDKIDILTEDTIRSMLAADQYINGDTDAQARFYDQAQELEIHSDSD